MHYSCYKNLPLLEHSITQHGCYTCLHKYHSLEDWQKFAKEHPEALPYVAASAGTAHGDFERLCEVLNNVEGVDFICLDVANGYSQFFVEFVTKVRKAFPRHTIMVRFSILNVNISSHFEKIYYKTFVKQY